MHVVFNVVFGNLLFVIVISNNRGRKMRFCERSQYSFSEKSIFGQFEVFFSTYKLFPWLGWFFSVSTFKEKYFDENASSPVGVKKSYLILSKSTDFGHFWLPRSTFKVGFRYQQAKFEKNSSSFAWRRLLGTLC